MPTEPSRRTNPACEAAAAGDLEGLRALPASALAKLDPLGSSAVHWAASCGHVHVLAWLIDEGGCDAESEGLISTRSKRRRPLHWAARNGQLDAVRFLVEDAGVDPDPRDRQSVSPFQLAVWQCWPDVARYLVDARGVDPRQLNSFACGAQHWIGTVPRPRAQERLPRSGRRVNAFQLALEKLSYSTVFDRIRPFSTAFGCFPPYAHPSYSRGALRGWRERGGEAREVWVR